MFGFFLIIFIWCFALFGGINDESIKIGLIVFGIFILFVLFGSCAA